MNFDKKYLTKEVKTVSKLLGQLDSHQIPELLCFILLYMNVDLRKLRKFLNERMK